MENMYIIATNEDGVIFGNYFTEVMTLEQAKKKLEQVRKLKDKAGIVGPKVSPHTMRHSFAKNFLLNGGKKIFLIEHNLNYL